MMQLWLAFSAGILSFLAPCMLPLYPVYLSRITGLTVVELKEDSQSKLKLLVIIHTVLFILGVSVIYMALAFSTSFIGDFFVAYRNGIRMLSGLLMIMMGIFLLGIFQPKWLMKDQRRFSANKQAGNYFSSFIIGVGFAAGWTPCIGPILSSILSMSLTNPSKSMLNMACYILGFAIPFMISALFLTKVMKLTKYAGIVSKIGGVIIIAVGVLMMTNKLAKISSALNGFFSFTPFL